MTEEERLIAGLKKRRHGSLERAIELYTPYVTVVAYNVIGAVMTKEDIEEVVSDVFVSLWRGASMIDAGKGSLRAYLAAAARNGAKNKLRSLRPSEEIDERTVSSYPEPYESLEKKEERALIIELINALGEPDSEIFFRYYYYGEKIKKIAAATGLCAATVKTKLSRGRKKIREMLIERGNGNEQAVKKA